MILLKQKKNHEHHGFRTTSSRLNQLDFDEERLKIRSMGMSGVVLF